MTTEATYFRKTLQHGVQTGDHSTPGNNIPGADSQGATAGLPKIVPWPVISIGNLGSMGAGAIGSQSDPKSDRTPKWLATTQIRRD